MPASLLAVVTLVLYLGGLAGIAVTGARADESAYDPPSSWAEPEPDGKPCPVSPEPIAEPPPPSEGEEEELAPEVDPVLRELRSQRIEAVEICEAQTASARELQRRLWWSVAEAARQFPFVETMNEHLANLDGAKCSSPCSVFLEGGHVNVTGVEDGPVEVTGLEGGPGGGIGESETLELVSSIDAGAESSQVGLYLIAGLLVSCFVGYCFWRTVQSGT